MPKGQCLHLNQMLRNFWGVEEDAVAEFNWASTMHPRGCGRNRPHDDGCIGQAQSPWSVKGRYLNANQQYRVLETHARPRFSRQRRVSSA